jgi:hypothetical protein
MAGLTNFLQWNPNQVNQETDAQYQADSQRIGGAPVGTPFPSRTGNKALYQVSTGVAALMQMMANKGFNVTDVNFGNLASVLSAIQTTADQKAPLVVVPYSPTASFQANLTSTFQMTLNGNATSCSIGNWSAGQIISFILIQGGGGGFTFHIPGVNMWPPVINGTPGSSTLVQIVARQDLSLWPAAQSFLWYNPVIRGLGVGQLAANVIYIGWSLAGRLKATVDVTDLGNFVFDSQLNAATAPLQTGINTNTANIASNTTNISNNTSAINTINAALAAFSGSLTTNGYVALRVNGGASFYIQWGTTGDFDPTITVTFPIAFPSTCAVVMGNDIFAGSSRIVSTVSSSRTGVTFQKDGTGNGIHWIALGY